MADVAIFIGRFQPLHAGHIAVAKRALERHDNLIIAIGSANRAGRTKNPYTAQQRIALWQDALMDHEKRSNVHFIPLDDVMYSDNEWIAQVRHRVSEAIYGIVEDDSTATVALTGHLKDDSSYYLRFFPEWEEDLIDKSFDILESTRIREFFYDQYVRNPDAQLSPDMFFGNQNLRGLSANSLVWSSEYQNVLRELAPEWHFDVNYDPSIYDVNVLTVDAVVVQNGHVLTVRRKNRPGMGLMALPGGHLERGETLEDAMLRELREETKIDMSDRVLRANIRSNMVFDDPNRSSRARVITQAYLIKLPDEDSLVKVKGGDDAARAFWTPLSEVRYEDWFEDHAAVIHRMTAGL